jgi:chaperonin cofactor prefoldin
MLHATEEPSVLDLAVELGDDDVAREYEELSEMEDLDALAPRTGGEGALLETVGELALVRDELEELAELENREDFASTRMAEAESTEDRVARRYEGLDVDELDALAHWDEEAESRAAPDDDIGREVEQLDA